MKHNKYKVFLLSLLNHPGTPIAFILSVFGFFAGLEDGLQYGFIAMGIMSIFWIPVVFTAWKNREIYSGINENDEK